MMSASVVFILFLIESSFTVDLNIYKSVTEIRQNEKGSGKFEYSFSSDEYSNIVDGSISWEGTPFVKEEIYQTIDTLKNALVNVRRSSECECNVIQAKIIDPNSMLLENLETGVFFYADRNSIEFKATKPSDSGTTLTIEFQNKKTEYEGTLSYLMRGITWMPNYDLFFTNNEKCDLLAYASIRNNQQQRHNVDNTQLYSGDLQLATVSSPPMAYRSFGKGGLEGSDSIQLGGEQKGFYFYSLKTNYILRPTSTVRLPFITVHPTCRFYYKATASISTGQSKGVFRRNYDLIPDKFLPGGILTIRDNKVLVGQSNLPDVPENYTQSVTLGQDNDVRYVVKGNLTASSEDNAKITWRTYSLDVTISNYKTKGVDGQLNFYGAIKTSINSTTCDSATVDGNTINIPFEIKKGGNHRCKMVVTLNWG